MKRSLVLACLAVAIALAAKVDVSRGQSENQEAGSGLMQSEELAKEYLDAFRKSGVPTPSAVDAAFKAAETANSVESWQLAGRLANAYANVVDVLSGHYSDLYSSSENRGANMSLLSTAANYERKRNVYLSMRNRSYIRIARIYLGQGEKGQALSFAVTAVKLSGAEPNKEGEALIRQIIEYKE